MKGNAGSLLRRHGWQGIALLITLAHTAPKFFCGRTIEGGDQDILRTVVITGIMAFAIGSVAQAQDKTPDEVRDEAEAAFGVRLPELEAYPDSGVVGAWSWMQDVEDGKGAIDPKVAQLIGLAVASQIPCQYCIYYHTKAAAAEGASEQEIREAAALAAYTRNWSTVLYGAQTDFEEYKKMVDTLFAPQ